MSSTRWKQFKWDSWTSGTSVTGSVWYWYPKWSKFAVFGGMISFFVLFLPYITRDNFLNIFIFHIIVLTIRKKADWAIVISVMFLFFVFICLVPRTGHCLQLTWFQLIVNLILKWFCFCAEKSWIWTPVWLI